MGCFMLPIPDMIDKAKDVEVLINDAALQQRQQIEENTQFIVNGNHLGLIKRI